MSYLEIVAASLFLFITNTKQDDIGYFWHLTDIHCDLHYVNKSCNLPYGNYSCDSSPNLALSAISATRELFAKKPDFVIWSGDNGPHDDSVSSEQLLDGIRLLSKAMKQAFPIDEVYILPVLGNHDVIPANNMEVTLNSRSRTTWCHKLGDDLQLWGEWINHPQKHLTSPVSLQSSSNFPRANFSQTCFFSHHLVNIGAYNQYDYDQRMNSTRRTNLILISLNGLIWYQGNILANDEDHDPLGQLDWLQKTFQWARKQKAKILLVSHFPPGASENTPQSYQFLRSIINDQFVNLLIENADLLMAGLFAHEHVDSFRLLVTKSNISVASLFLMPSISPLLLNGLGDFNPRIRLYRYKRSTMKLLGYAQYYFNLEKQLSLINHSILNNWQLEYDTLTTYHMNDLSPRSLTILYNNFMKEDNNYWSYYWQYELGGRQHLSFQPNYLTNDTGLCPRVKSQCRCDHLCAIRNLLLNNLIECLQLCKDINYTLYNNNGDNVLHNSLLTVILSDHINYSIYLNRSIINQISITNSSERSSLPYIIGVIVAFLVILIGIVLIVNREVCNRHRGYQQRRSLLTSIIHGGGGGALNTLNGGLPITSFLQGTRTPRTTTNNNAGGGVKSTRINDHYGIGGSCIELHTSFNPSYDNLYPYYFNKSMSSLNGHDFSNTDGRGRRGDDDDDDDSGRNQQTDVIINQYGIISNGLPSEILSPTHMISYYGKNNRNSTTTNSSSCCSSSSNSNQCRTIQDYIGKRYSVPDYTHFTRSYPLKPPYMYITTTGKNNNHNNEQVENKIHMHGEKSNTTCEQSSNYHQYISSTNQQIDITCLPEDYYADDEAFADEDNNELNHNNYYIHQNNDYTNHNEQYLSSKNNYNHINIGKKLRLKSKPIKYNHHHDDHDENICNRQGVKFTEEVGDSIDDQESQLLDNDGDDDDVKLDGVKHLKDRKFTFFRSKLNDIDVYNKHSSMLSHSQSAVINQSTIKNKANNNNNDNNNSNLGNCSTSSLIILPNELNINQLNDIQHCHQVDQQTSQSSYTSPSRCLPKSSSSITTILHHQQYPISSNIPQTIDLPSPPSIQQQQQQQKLFNISSLRYHHKSLKHKDNKTLLNCDHDPIITTTTTTITTVNDVISSPTPSLSISASDGGGGGGGSSPSQLPTYDYVRMSS